MRRIYNKLWFSLSLQVIRKGIEGSRAWEIFNHLKIPGFGTNLVRFYFPIYYVDKPSRDSFSDFFIEDLTHFLHAQGNYAELIEQVSIVANDFLALPDKEENPQQPYLDNWFYGLIDAAVAGAIVKKYQPKTILEIGSGVSTRIMKYSIDRFNVDSKIICIDPEPRVDIDSVADLVIKKPLEDSIPEIKNMLKAGDILFMDGSHYVFQENDTTTFFFKLLPVLPKGVLIHIHDIYLPFDYPPNVQNQLWSEQYLLACLIMGGFKDYKVVFPTYFLSKENEKFKKSISTLHQKITGRAISGNQNAKEGYGFWMVKI